MVAFIRKTKFRKSIFFTHSSITSAPTIPAYCLNEMMENDHSISNVFKSMHSRPLVEFFVSVLSDVKTIGVHLLSFALSTLRLAFTLPNHLFGLVIRFCQPLYGLFIEIAAISSCTHVGSLS